MVLCRVGVFAVVVLGSYAPRLMAQDTARVSVIISGRVVSKATRRPVRHGVVRLDTAGTETAVDSTGAFRIAAAVGPGEHWISGRAISYMAAKRPVLVRDSSQIRLPDLQLEESAVRLIVDYVPTCKPMKREPKRVPKGYWVSAEPDSTANNKFVLCHAGPR